MRENENVTSLLVKKSEQVRAGAALLVGKTRDWQVIKQYLSNRLNEMELTGDQQSKLERYQFVYNQLVSGKYTKPEVVNLLKKLFHVGTSQAYEDINHSQEIFAAVVNINKQFELQLELESARAMKRKCIEVNDIQTAARVQKNIIQLIALLPDEENSPGEDFEGHTIEAVFDPQLLGAGEIDMDEVLKAINAKRKVPIKTDMFLHLNPEKFEEAIIDQSSNEEAAAL
ncbi:MAG: hypothetical protein V4594_16880 [Bacteroidota bacterium]